MLVGFEMREGQLESGLRSTLPSFLLFWHCVVAIVYLDIEVYYKDVFVLS